VTCDTGALKSAFVTYVRPLREHNSVVWSPQQATSLIKLFEH